MFSFEPADKGLYISGIDDNVEQRFVVRFGAESESKKLENRLFVVLDKENIRFLYYDNDEQTETLNADYLKEVGYISLNYQKYTGNDILDFPQMSCGEIENLPDAKIANKIIDSFKELFHGFPFLEGKTKNNPNKEKDFWTKIKITIGSVISKFKKKDKKEETESQERVLAFSKLLKCCLLAFVFKIEDRSEVFAQSPLYEHVRDTLRKSDVYQLLSAKIQYTLSVPKDGLVYNSKEYSYKARKFADCLMSQRINKIIPHNNYGNSEGKQGWFYDPEKELDVILEQNRKQEKEGQCKLDENLVLKIRNFLYTKHAVYQAMTDNLGKFFFLLAQSLMFITSLMIILSCIKMNVSDTILNVVFPLLITTGWILSLFIKLPNTNITITTVMDELRDRIYEKNNTDDNNLLNKIVYVISLFSTIFLPIFSILLLFYSVSYKIPDFIQYGFYIDVVLCVILGIILSGIFNRNGSSGVRYAFYPRILVAELVGWLTIGIAEDLVKSMLWISEWWKVVIALVMVLILVVVLISGEAKQHSPYKKTWNIICSKTLPIVNHSLFFASFFGLIMQAVFYDNLIKTSNVLSDVVYDDYFNKANSYCQNLESLDKTIERYLGFCDASELKGITVAGEGKNVQKISVNDSTIITISMGISNRAFNDSKEDIGYHNTLVDCCNGIIDELDSLCNDNDIKVDFSKSYKSICKLNKIDLDTLPSDSIKKDTNKNVIYKKNEEAIKTMLVSLQKEITNVRRNTLKFNDYETLMSWATIGCDSIVQTGSAYLDSLTIKAKNNHKCCRKINVPVLSEKRIFPTLLIFHTLIVLVLAFVTQLIISDKTVTEPL